ncbi:hypothetical protein BD310DRAFT_829937 [Dichomitus squalens]|uniref:F-box domain-containing protein n=1 Tax=Dichomitus squalens TaxID=114155 RepID=A0A4V2K6T9_9APHY|nr:hypothetical protein BD310DRAFT_829937 [Dichomitus squalens]
MFPMDDLATSLHPSPSVSSPAQSPALPWEVIEKVIDCCSGDTTTLCAFALTCSQLHPRSLFVLFTNVDLRSMRQLMAFYHAVQAQPRLQPVVQTLSFPRVEEEFSPFPLLSILPGLHQLAFDTFFSLDIDNELPSQSTALCGWQFATSLRDLTIRSTGFRTRTVFLQFLSVFPNVENLTCERLYPFHRVLFRILGSLVLNERKMISWSDEFRRWFHPISENWKLTEDVKYCESRWMTILPSQTLT